MFIKQVMARPVPTHPKWKYSLNRESMILFFHKKILYGTNVVYAEGWQQSKKRMAYSTIFPAILYRMKCPYSPANYLKGDYEVRAVTMKEQRTTGGELKKNAVSYMNLYSRNFNRNLMIIIRTKSRWNVCKGT